MSIDPTKVLIAGDWHGNRRWAMDVIARSRRLLPDENPRIIVQLGDFGFWPWKEKDWAEGDPRPEALRYVQDVNAALILAEAYLLVTPGNHDDYDAMERWQSAETQWLAKAGPYTTFCPIAEGVRLRRILILPRGHRWEWHGRTWLSVGGAVSVDRLLPSPGRVEHETWWPQEEVTDEQADAIIDAGHADVMVTHDSPSGVTIPRDHHMQPFFAPEDLERAKAHSERMQRIVNAVRPAYYMHGHHHRRYQRTYGWYDRVTRFDGMDMDGEPGNFAVLNVRTMEWE